MRCVVVVGSVAGFDFKSELAYRRRLLALADRFVEYYGNIESVSEFADRHGDVLFLRSVLCRFFSTTEWLDCP